eukprot:435774_1
MAVKPNNSTDITFVDRIDLSKLIVLVNDFIRNILSKNIMIPKELNKIIFAFVEKKIRPKLLSQRPCISGSLLTGDKFDTWANYFFQHDAQNYIWLNQIKEHKICDRKEFLRELIYRAIGRCKCEQLSCLISLLLDEHILFMDELDECFISFFEHYSEEDDPKINIYTAQLIAPLIIHRELSFDDILKWIILDIRSNQPIDGMLKWYKADGIRNYIKQSKTITMAMDFLARLLKQIKQIKPDDCICAKYLLENSNFILSNYINQNNKNDIYNIKQEWIQKYELQFAF